MSGEYLGLLDIYREFEFDWSFDNDYIWWDPSAKILFEDHKIDHGDRFARYLSLAQFEKRIEIFRQYSLSENPFFLTYFLRLKDNKICKVREEGAFYRDAQGNLEGFSGSLKHLSDITDSPINENKLPILEQLEHLKALDEVPHAAFLYFSIDQLSLIGMNYGLDFLNHTVETVSQKMKNSIRYYDTFGRLSGNGFGMILQKCGQQEVVVVAKRLVESMATLGLKTPHGKPVTISIGGSLIDIGKETPVENILDRSEAAMLDSKHVKKIATPLALMEQRQTARQKEFGKRRAGD